MSWSSSPAAAEPLLNVHGHHGHCCTCSNKNNKCKGWDPQKVLIQLRKRHQRLALDGKRQQAISIGLVFNFIQFWRQFSRLLVGTWQDEKVYCSWTQWSEPGIWVFNVESWSVCVCACVLYIKHWRIEWFLNKLPVRSESCNKCGVASSTRNRAATPALKPSIPCCCLIVNLVNLVNLPIRLFCDDQVLWLLMQGRFWSAGFGSHALSIWITLPCGRPIVMCQKPSQNRPHPWKMFQTSCLEKDMIYLDTLADWYKAGWHPTQRHRVPRDGGM